MMGKELKFNLVTNFPLVVVRMVVCHILGHMNTWSSLKCFHTPIIVFSANALNQIKLK